MALTAKQVAGLKPREQRYDRFDGSGTGLGVRVAPTGTKTWFVSIQTGDKARRVTLGRYPDVTLASARERAGELRRQHANGEAVDSKIPWTVTELADDWLRRSEMARTTRVNRRLWLDKWILPALGSMPVHTVKRRHVAALLDRILDTGKRATANRVRATVRQIFAYAISRDLVEVNPATGTASIQEGERRRVLSDAELRWLLARNDDPIPRSLCFQAATGARIGEVVAMTWGEVDGATWTIPAERQKSRREHTVPLTALALEQLSKDDPVYPFASRNYNSAHVMPQSIAHWLKRRGCTFTSHDIRRTVRTRLAKHAPPWVCERVIGHVVGDEVERRYDRYDYAAEMRAALEAWESELRLIFALS